MFLNHFKLADHPFREAPPPDWLQADDRFGQALARLEFFRRQAEFALVVGQTGVGKTSLPGLFRQSMPKNRYRPGRSFRTYRTMENPGLEQGWKSIRWERDGTFEGRQSAFFPAGQ